MKKVLFILCLLWLNCLNAQEPTNTYAKQSYVTLNAALQKLSTMKPNSPNYQVELDKAQRKIESIKQNEPDFDISAKEQELQGYVAQRALAVNADTRTETEQRTNQEGEQANAQVPLNEREAAIRDADLLEKEMNALFKSPQIHEFESNGQLASNAEAILTEYQKQCDAFVQNQAYARIQKAQSIHRYLDPEDLGYERQGFEMRIASIEETIDKATTADIALTHYYTLRKYALYWNTLHTVLPEDPAISKNLEIIQLSLKKYPSTESIRSDVQKRHTQFMANTKMPEAVRKDAALETKFRDNFAQNDWNETVLSIHLLDSDWHVYRDEFNGAILGRYQTAAIAVKDANGNCLYYEYSITQDFNGSSYQQNVRRYGFNRYALACENAQ